MAKDFYEQLKPFTDFNKAGDLSQYKPAPDDWLVVLTDIQGSTAAIQEGRYKDVNMAGAASIACVLNCLKPLEVPFVFGGDGATLLIPSDFKSSVLKELKKLQHFAKVEFNLVIRVGFVPVSLVRLQRSEILVAKYQLSGKNNLAMFLGGGLTLAEKILKSNAPGAEMIFTAENEKLDMPLLDGLSCRWNPVASKMGITLSVLVLAIDSLRAPEIYQKILADIQAVHPMEGRKRIGFSKISRQWESRSQASTRTQRTIKSVGLFIWSLVLRFLFFTGLPLGTFKPKKYLSETMQNTDYRKFDDMLRMVVDINPSEKNRIEKMLINYYERGEIYYGLHESSHAMMTCLVFSTTENEHVHFVDGTNGGYALAAQQLKKQMRKT